MYCNAHDLGFNVTKSICMFFKCAINKKCDNPCIFLNGNKLEFIQETKYFRYCTHDVKCMLFKSFCTTMYCSTLWFNSNVSCARRLRISYNNVLRRLLGIPKRSMPLQCLLAVESQHFLSCCALIFLVLYGA